MNALRRASGPDTKQPEAYSKYMKAKFFSTTRTRNSLAKAIDLLHEAILIDPNYARAPMLLLPIATSFKASTSSFRRQKPIFAQKLPR